jgi:excinuclease UvrABC helicase subunit UvrB
VFGEDSKQEDIYNGANVDQMIENVIDGFHSTIFCYGQTGSGKTFTMDGYKYKKTEKGIFLPVGDEEMIAANYGLV